MGILARLFGSRSAPEGNGTIVPAGVLKDEDGWYYEESQDFSSAQRSLRIDQDRPGDWYVHKSFCEVEGLNDPERADAVRKFFAGSYRWLVLERDRSVPRSRNTVKVLGTFLDTAGREQTSSHRLPGRGAGGGRRETQHGQALGPHPVHQVPERRSPTDPPRPFRPHGRARRGHLRLAPGAVLARGEHARQIQGCREGRYGAHCFGCASASDSRKSKTAILY